MKKVLSLLLAAVTAVSLTSCANSTANSEFSRDSAGIEVITEDSGQNSGADVVSAETPEQTFDSSENAPEDSMSPQDSDEVSSFAGTQEQTSVPDESGSYTSRDDVALYIHNYGHLPQNFITKKEARELGWDGGSVEEYAPGKCIGGDHFGNYEGLLPDKPGRSYTECDIDTLGKSGRGAKRIIFSNDGLIYYTEDHYASFTLLYGEE